MPEIRVPRLGWSMESGVFVRWLKRDGEVIKMGDALYELEGEKATQEIEAVDAGVLRIPPEAPAPGSTVAVGALLGHVVLDEEESDVGWDKLARIDSPSASDNLASAGPPESTPGRGGPPRAAGPAARRLARELGVELKTLAGAGRIAASEVRQHVGQASLPAVAEKHATPRARRVARELGIDWKSLSGTGRNGRIRERDVVANEQRGQAPPLVLGSLPLTSRRRTIAQRMVQSRQQTAPVTLTTKADATNLVSLRRQFKATGGVVPTYTDIVAKLVAAALQQQHSLLAGRLEGDAILLPDADGMNIGIAVDTEAGLVVPVLRNVPNLSLLQLAAQSAELVERSRRGALKAEEMQGGVFTITNLGGYGIDAFTPIINLPECAILGLGAIRREAVVEGEDRIVPRDQITLSLTFDHRLVDGAPAARFLQTVRTAIENPSAWLLG